MKNTSQIDTKEQLKNGDRVQHALHGTGTVSFCAVEQDKPVIDVLLDSGGTYKSQPTSEWTKRETGRRDPSRSDQEPAATLAEKLQTLLSALQDVPLPSEILLAYVAASQALDDWHRNVR